MVIVLGILAICLVAMAPMVWMLVWMRNDGNRESNKESYWHTHTRAHTHTQRERERERDHKEAQTLTKHFTADCMRRQPQRQGVLPTTTGRSPSTQDLRPRKPPGLLLPLAGKARLVASRLRGHAVAAGHATALRCRHAFLRLQERLAQLSPTSLLRRRRTAASKTVAAADSTYGL
jgi:hypothetical protein